MLIKMVPIQIQFIMPNFEHVLDAYLILITFGKYDRFEIVSNTIVSPKKRVIPACTTIVFLCCIYVHKLSKKES